ncbi:MAG: hypothetical protein ACLPXW_17530 [Xanthobacteraceae bacterium]
MRVATSRLGSWALAEKRGATVPLMVGHRLVGTPLLFTGDIAEGRAHYDRGFVLYDPVEYRSFAPRFGRDISVSILGFRQLALWLLGYPDAALADADCALNEAREIGHAATLMYALNHAAMMAHIYCGNYKAAKAELDELVALANEKDAPFWKALATINKGGATSCGWQSVGRDQNVYLRDGRISINRSNTLSAATFIKFSECVCGSQSIRRSLALHQRSDDGGRNN